MAHALGTPSQNHAYDEAFDKVHLNIDTEVDPDFASVEQSMDARIEELEAIAQ